MADSQRIIAELLSAERSVNDISYAIKSIDHNPHNYTLARDVISDAHYKIVEDMLSVVLAREMLNTKLTEEKQKLCNLRMQALNELIRLTANDSKHEDIK